MVEGADKTGVSVCFSSGVSLTRHFSFSTDGPSYVTFNIPVSPQDVLFKSTVMQKIIQQL